MRSLEHADHRPHPDPVGAAWSARFALGATTLQEFGLALFIGQARRAPTRRSSSPRRCSPCSRSASPATWPCASGLGAAEGRLRPRTVAAPAPTAGDADGVELWPRTPRPASAAAPRQGGAPARPRGTPAAAAPQEGQEAVSGEVARRSPVTTRPTWPGHIRDIPDFPRPGDPVPRHHAPAGRPRRPGPRRRRTWPPRCAATWARSTGCWAWRPAASCSARPWHSALGVGLRPGAQAREAPVGGRVRDLRPGVRHRHPRGATATRCGRRAGPGARRRHRHRRHRGGHRPAGRAAGRRRWPGSPSWSS